MATLTPGNLFTANTSYYSSGNPIPVYNNIALGNGLLDANTDIYLNDAYTETIETYIGINIPGTETIFLDNWFFMPANNAGISGIDIIYHIRGKDSVTNNYVTWTSKNIINITPTTTTPTLQGSLSDIHVFGMTQTAK